MVTKLASAVVAARTVQPFKTVKDFDDVITSVLRREGHLNEATLPFLALRIAVNTEIQNLKTLITDGFSLLASKGRFAIISFHSLEDHVVKHAFQAYEQRGEGILITHGVVIAKDTEIEGNPRARSAKLRVIEKN
jgi:16S rRNA (cytosine1402-N4)-methyltransferase